MRHAIVTITMNIYGRTIPAESRKIHGNVVGMLQSAAGVTLIDLPMRFRISLEQRHYASTTINLRLAAVRRLAYEPADCGLLSANLAAGIRRVKGAKRLGVPVGSWLIAEQGKHLSLTADSGTLRGKRDYATLVILLGCGLRTQARNRTGMGIRRKLLHS